MRTSLVAPAILGGGAEARIVSMFVNARVQLLNVPAT